MGKVEILSQALGVAFLVVGLGWLLPIAQEAWKDNRHVALVWWAAATAFCALCGTVAICLPIAYKADAEAATKPDRRDEPRAWVGPVLFTTQPQQPAVGQPLGAEVTIKNYGATPALNVRGHSVVEPVAPGQRPNFNYAADPSLSVAVMQPNAEHFTQHRLSRRHDGTAAPLDQQMLDALRNGQIRIAAHGRLTYDDVSGRRHWVEWCHYLSADFSSWVDCESHNGIGTEQATEVDQSKRAWLTVIGATLMPDFAVGKQLRVVIKFTNTGQTPALDVVVTGDVVSRESIDLVEFKTDSLAGPAPSRMVIAPGTTGTVVISHSAPIPSQAHIDAFLQGTYTVFARGFILYRDVHGKGHRTLYCFKASGSDFKTMSELGGGMSACDRWNTAE